MASACADPSALEAADLYGLWDASFTDGGPAATLQLGPHPEYAGSLRGVVRRATGTVEAAGDIEEGDVTLEESDNGRNISATWTGRIIEHSCGQRIEGTWNDARTTAATARLFTLQRLATPDAVPRR